MLKNILIKLTFSILFFSFLSPLTGANVQHGPDNFLILSDGRHVTAPQKITAAERLHKKNITGKGIKIAVIDIEIHPQEIGILRKKGCILPSVIQKKMVLTPDENLDQLDLTALASQPSPLMSSSQYNDLVARKKYFDQINELSKSDLGHGTVVLRALHAIAPGAQLLPIDLKAMYCVEPRAETPDALPTHWLPSAFREAIVNKVDGISMSLSTYDRLHRNFVDILKEVSNKGIALMIAAGNNSTNKRAFSLGTVQDRETLIHYKRDEKKAYEESNGKNMLFCGSVGYSRTGQECLSNFSEHPTADTLRRYILAPGQNMIYPQMNPSKGCDSADLMPQSGTSISTPIVAGGFALLKQYAMDKGLAHTNDDLLRLLQDSGHALNHNIPGSPFKTYKVLNLQNAMQRVDSLISQPQALPSATPVKKIRKSTTVAPKRRTTARKAPVRTKRKNTAVAPKRRTLARKAPVRNAREGAVVRKRRARAIQKF